MEIARKIITGIGTRTPPEELKPVVVRIARMLYDRGYTLRSGGADGMDSLFEAGFPDNKEIYLPWKKFNKNPSPLYNVSPEALELASKHHAVWSQLSDGAKRLMARNCYQALGLDLNTSSDLVVCYTWDGCQSHLTRSITTGGTGMAIELASLRNIPIINMFNPNWEANLMLTLEEIEHAN
jgi:hypothetical protein